MNDAFPSPSDPHLPRTSAHGWSSISTGAGGNPPAGPASNPYADEVVRSVEDLAAMLPPPPKLPPIEADLAASDFPPRRRRILLPIVLFLACCASTYWVGINSFVSGQLELEARTAAAEEVNSAVQNDSSLKSKPAEQAQLRQQVHDDYLLKHNAVNGLTYMFAVMSILVAHELGHFLQTVRHRIPSSLPFFIPMPIGPLGTMGAVIGMSSNLANRRQLFDIGVSGPIAGLVLCIPITCYGILIADHTPIVSAPGVTHFADPWIITELMHYLRPELPANHELTMNPFLQAGWVGMLITGLNMLPVSQLDGGHVVHTLFGPRVALVVARAFVVLTVLYIIGELAIGWIPMFTLVLLLGIQHPPSADDTIELSAFQRIVAFASLAIPFACFPAGGIYL